jgi:ech hydrogenase subunit E
MSSPTTVQNVTDLLKDRVRSVTPKPDGSFDVEIDIQHIIPAVTAIAAAKWGYLSAITGLDYFTPPAEGGAASAAPAETGLGVLYHFVRDACVLTLRVKLPREKPVIPSVCAVLPSAILQERELRETFGIQITGIPVTERFLLSDDWPAGLYPMRKEYTPEAVQELREAALPAGTGTEAQAAAGGPAAGRGAGLTFPVPGAVDFLPSEAGAPAPIPDKPGKFVVPIGPQHPALKEPAHFELSVDGEIVTDASLRLGYVHRGIEKAAENRSWVQNLYLVERICGICSHIHATAYVLGVEKLAGIAAPPRAEAIRVIFAEMERIHSHLLWLGVAAHQAGFDTLFMFSWRDRETIMNLLDEVCGNRVNYAVNLVGGVKYDIDTQRMDAIRRGMDFLEGRIHHYLEVVTRDESFLRRTRGVGVFSTETADILGVVGPTARASGVRRDLRVDAPYSAYHQFPVTMVVDDGCDLAARFQVRIKELFEAIRLIRAILDALPAGDLAVPVPRRIPAGETISRVEGPRGELLYYLRSDGGVKPQRVKVRTPSLANWAYVLGVAVGHRLADIPMIVVGIDPCFSCNDRSVAVRRAGEEKRMSWDELVAYGIRYYGGLPK